MSSGAQKIPVWEQQAKKSLNTFYTSPATQYGRILVKQNYDYHYKWVGKAAASTDCRTSEDVLKQLAFLQENPRWKPSKDSQYLKQEQDLWMDRLIKTAKPAINTKTSAHVLRYAAFRRANPTGRAPIVERYVQKKLRKNHVDNLKRMTAAVDNSPPARAMQHHEQCLRQPYTRTGVLKKRPKSQQSSRFRRRGLHNQGPLLPASGLSPEQCLPGRRPLTADADPLSHEGLDDMDVVVQAERAHVPLEHLHRMRRQRMGQTSAASSEDIHLPISAAREALEGHARELGGARHSMLEGGGCQDATMRAAARWPPDVPEGDENLEVGAAASPTRSPTKAALAAQRDWLATAPAAPRYMGSAAQSPACREEQQHGSGDSLSPTISHDASPQVAKDGVDIEDLEPDLEDRGNIMDDDVEEEMQEELLVAEDCEEVI